MLANVLRLTILTVTAAAVCPGRAEMSRLVPLTTVKLPGPEAAHRFTLVGVPAVN